MATLGRPDRSRPRPGRSRARAGAGTVLSGTGLGHFPLALAAFALVRVRRPGARVGSAMSSSISRIGRPARP